MPVGEDQKQHLELARDIAGAFNRRYGVEFFPLPEPQIFGAATRVMSLRDGTKKMSKSDASDYSRINMTDDADSHRAQDPQGQDRSRSRCRTTRRRTAEARPEADNLLGIYAALADIDRERGGGALRRQEFLRLQAASSPSSSAEVLGKIGGEMRRLVADPGYIDGVLRRGAERANAIAAAQSARGLRHHGVAAAIAL